MSTIHDVARIAGVSARTVAFLPVGDLSFDNHFEAFTRAPVGRFTFNSVLVTVVTVVLSLFFCSTAGS